MSDLRALPELLVREGAVRTPSATAIAGRAHRVRTRRAGLAAAMVLVAAVAAAGSVGPDAEQQRVRVGDGRATTTTTTSGSGAAPDAAEGGGPAGPSGAGAGRGAAAPAAAPPPPKACRAGANGGATGPGVTENRIRLVGGALLEGPWKEATEEAVVAWKMVIDEANRGGGICGRLLDLAVVNNLYGRPPANLGHEGYVGMLAGPHDPAFPARVTDGTIATWGIPVVASEGTERPLFSSPLVWPVGAPPSAIVRAAAHEAYRTGGARTFAVVYDSTNAWGREAADALAAYVRSLPGAELRAEAALDPGDPSYSTEVHKLSSTCDGRCDAVVLALWPETAKKWFQSGFALGAKRTASLPTLLNNPSGEDCARMYGDDCDNIWVWTAFTPPVPSFTDDPAVRAYADHFDNDLRQGTTGAYVGARVLVEALRRAGPNLTRATLQQALDDLTYTSPLVGRLDWGPRVPTDRVGNTSARGVRLMATGSTFDGWADAGTGWVADPTPGLFPD